MFGARLNPRGVPERSGVSERRGVSESERFLKAQVSSGVATAVDWGLMTGLILAGLHYLLAVCAGAAVGAAIDFSIKRWWAFRATHLPLRRSAPRYLVVSATSAGLNCALAYVLVDLLRLPKVPGAILASIVIGFTWNYAMHRLYVFGRAA